MASPCKRKPAMRTVAAMDAATLRANPLKNKAGTAADMRTHHCPNLDKKQGPVGYRAMSAIEALKTARAAGAQFGIDGDGLLLEGNLGTAGCVHDALSRHRLIVAVMPKTQENRFFTEELPHE